MTILGVSLGTRPTMTIDCLDTDGKPLPLRVVLNGYVKAVLSFHGGNKVRTARALGVSRRSLYRWLAGRQDSGLTDRTEP